MDPAVQLLMREQVRTFNNTVPLHNVEAVADNKYYTILSAVQGGSARRPTTTLFCRSYYIVYDEIRCMTRLGVIRVRTAHIIHNYSIII